MITGEPVGRTCKEPQDLSPTMKPHLNARSRRVVWMTVTACALFLPALVRGQELKTTREGIAVGAKGLGDFTLTYPVFLTSAQQPAHKVVETRADGKTAAVRYEDGAQVAVALGGDGKVTLAFAHIPADVKHIRMSMLIDIAFSNGGRWKIGETSGAFPRAKPATPHLCQANAMVFQLTNARGEGLTLRVPQYSFQQLTDNREWNWPIFNWMFIAPFDPAHSEMTVAVSAEHTDRKSVV